MAAQLDALTASPVSVHLERATRWSWRLWYVVRGKGLNWWAGRRPWVLSSYVNQASEGLLIFFSNKSELYTLSELIAIRFGEKLIALAEVQWQCTEKWYFSMHERVVSYRCNIHGQAEYQQYKGNVNLTSLQRHITTCDQRLSINHDSKHWMTGGRKSEEELVSIFGF